MRCYNCQKQNIIDGYGCEYISLCAKSDQKRFEEISKLDIKVGTKIKFMDQQYWWTCTYADNRFIIAIRFDKRLKNNYYYTICDLNYMVRGKDNLTLSYWDYSNPEVCKEAIKEFYDGELEVSYRNFVELDIREIRN